MTEFICYTRVSTKHQTRKDKSGKSIDGLGMKSQKAILDTYCTRGDDTIVQWFSEVASAKDIKGRPQLQQAVEMCIQGGYTLAVAKLDRLSRKTEDALEIWGRLSAKLYSCDIPQNNGTMDKFILTLFMALADRERELISIRTKAGLAQSDKPLGKHPHQQAHWLTEETRKLGPEKIKAEARDVYLDKLEYIQMLREKKMTYQQISDRLNETNHETRNGGKFYPNLVMRILNRGNEVSS